MAFGKRNREPTLAFIVIQNTNSAQAKPVHSNFQAMAIQEVSRWIRKVESHQALHGEKGPSERGLH